MFLMGHHTNHSRPVTAEKRISLQLLPSLEKNQLRTHLAVATAIPAHPAIPPTTNTDSVANAARDSINNRSNSSPNLLQLDQPFLATLGICLRTCRRVASGWPQTHLLQEKEENVMFSAGRLRFLLQSTTAFLPPHYLKSFRLPALSAS